MTDEKKVDLIATARISDISLRWTMVQLFFLIHSGLFSLLFTQFKPGTIVYALITAFGLWLAILWFFATVRANRQIDFWNRRLAELEMLVEHRVRVFSTPEGTVLSPPGVPIYAVLFWLVLPFLAAWITFFGYSLYKLFR